MVKKMLRCSLAHGAEALLAGVSAGRAAARGGPVWRFPRCGSAPAALR
jgi:hypothetical protein